MNRLSMLVTAEGDWVREGSAEFRAALGDLDPDYDASLFAVKNLGFIKFQILEESIIEIELHPRNVELPALLAVQQQLLSSQVKLFRIKYFDITWRSEITVSREGAVSRLSELCAPSFAPPPTQKFLVEPRDYSELFRDEGNPLRLLAQKWRMSFGFFDASVISFAVEYPIIVAPDGLWRKTEWGRPGIHRRRIQVAWAGLSAIWCWAKGRESARQGLWEMGIRVLQKRRQHRTAALRPRHCRNSIGAR